MGEATDGPRSANGEPRRVATGPATVSPDPTTPSADDDDVRPRPLDPPLTVTRLLGALVLACGLFFLMLVLFSLTGLGTVGLAPAIVISTALTGRVAHIRRLSALIAIGVLSFVFMVVATYTIAILAVLNSPQFAR